MPTTMPLFTPSESYALQSFLEHIDISGALDGISVGEAEWPAIYSAGSDPPSTSALSSASTDGLLLPPPPLPPRSHEHDYHRIASPAAPSSSSSADPRHAADVDLRVPSTNRSEQLAKAAKDLMSLDANPLKWTDSADHDLPYASRPPPPLRQHRIQPRASPSPARSSMTNTTTTPTTTTAPHLRPASSLSHFTASASSSSIASAGTNGAGRPRLAVAPSSSGASHTHNLSGDGLSAYDSLPSGSSVNSSDTSPPPLTPPSTSTSTVTANASAPSKRPHDALQDPTSSASTANSKKARSSRTAAAAANGTAHLNNPNVPIINTKPSLLSTSQKKANHIQSEQKRRANIRRGYEALCDTVPPLRDAIAREEEDQRLLARATGAGPAGAGESAGKVKKKLRARRKATTDSTERMDGRAGPRSENIVLSKTIDYIHDLLSEKAALLERLARARNVLARTGSAPDRLDGVGGGVPLWEREWGGGVGLLDNDSDDDAEDA